MSYKLKSDDYLELWIRFQDRADNVKEAMFKTLTWLVGYAAALLGFIFVNLTKYDATQAKISLLTLVAVGSIAGLVICLYSWFAISEAAKHIQGNWQRADRCAGQVEGLEEIIRGVEDKKWVTMKIWNQLHIIVALFASAFAAVLIWTAAIVSRI